MTRTDRTAEPLPIRFRRNGVCFITPPFFPAIRFLTPATPRAVLYLLLALFLVGAPAVATTYVPMADAVLADQAPLIIEGRVAEASSAPVSGRPATDYTVRVDRVLKGSLPSDPVTVRVPGGVGPSGALYRVWGAPRFLPGDHAILFLVPGRDGTFAVSQLMLGAFVAAPAESGEGAAALALRDLSEATAVAEKGGSGDLEARAVAAGQARDFEAFGDWLAARAAGEDAPARYFVDAPADATQRLAERYTLFEGSGKHFRWFNGGGTWYAYERGVSGMPGGGFSEVGRALAAWNADPGSSLSLSYGGTTSSSGGFSARDGANVVLFDDPNGEIAGSYSCGQGGVLAIGGFSGISGTGELGGQTFWRITEGDVVTQDGAGCYFAANGGANGELVFAHEIGHALGLGHSCGGSGNPSCADPVLNDALMRAYAHSDGRGARLGADDRAALAVLYGSGGGTGGGSGDDPSDPPSDPSDPSDPSEPDDPPADPPSDPNPGPNPKPPPPTDPEEVPAPGGLEAAVASPTSVELSWSRSGRAPDGIHVELRSGAVFVEVRRAPGSASGITIAGLREDTVYLFRVRARDGGAYSAYSNVARVDTGAPVAPDEPEEPDEPKDDPTSLSAGQVACDASRLGGLLERLRATAGTGGEPAGVNLSFTASGDFAGLVHAADGGAERHLAFSTNPEETTLLRNPERPQLRSASLTRNELNSDLIGDRDSAGLLRLTVDPTLGAGGAAPPNALLALDNLASSPDGSTSAKPGRGLGELVEPCHGGFGTADVHVFRVLTKLVRVRSASAVAFEVALYRAAAPGSYRIDAYALDRAGRSLGRVAARLTVGWQRGALRSGRIEVLPACGGGGGLHCTTFEGRAELLLEQPRFRAGAGGGAEVRVVAGAASSSESAVNWSVLLSDSTWTKPLSGPAGASGTLSEPAGAETGPLADAAVTCDGDRLEGLLDRLRVVAPSAAARGVNLSYTASGDFAGIAYAATAAGTGRQLAFSTNPEETTLLRNPERPQLFSVSLARNHLASDLASGQAGLVRVLIDPTLGGAASGSALLAVDNLSTDQASPSAARPGRGLAGLLAPCHGSLEERDVHVFRVLSRVARARIEGATQTELAIYRGRAADSYRIDAYGVSADGTRLGRLATELRVERSTDGALEAGTLRVLAACSAGETSGCTSLERAGELYLVSPSQAGTAGTVPVVVTASGSEPVRAKSGVDFGELLAGTTWMKPM